MNNLKTKIKQKLSNATRHLFLGRVMRKSRNYLPLTIREKTMIKQTIKGLVKFQALCLFLILLSIIWITPAAPISEFLRQDKTITTESAFVGFPEAQAAPQQELEVFEVLEEFSATVYAYNSFESQTDGDPCTGAFGYICDKKNVVANNCYLPGTLVEINDVVYEVYDRMNARYGCDVFDVYMGMDHQAAINHGKKQVDIKILRANK